jgi:hypothetical protein
MEKNEKTMDLLSDPRRSINGKPAREPAGIEAGSRGGIRTPDRVVNSHLLCRLSYPGISKDSAADELRQPFLYQKKGSFVK